MFEKADILDSPSSLPQSAPSPDCDHQTSVLVQKKQEPEKKQKNSKELKIGHLKSLKRKPFTSSMSLCQKRLRKKAKLQKIINLNKNKYNSLSSSSSFSSLSSSSSSFSQINDQSPVDKKDPPMKLHKFYHSVPFKCPFCFTFKEHPTDFIDHLANAHYSDVKLLYEKKSSTLIDNMNRKQEAMQTDDAESKDIKPEQTDVKMEVSKIEPNKALYTSSTLPPRKQQRLLKSPLNDTQGNEQNTWNPNTNDGSIKSEDCFNFYYSKTNLKSGYPFQQHSGFMMPSNLSEKADSQLKNDQFQSSSSSNKNLILAAAAAASMLSQHGPTVTSTPKANYSNKYTTLNSNSTEASMKCAICDRGFEYYSNLRRHIKTKHKIFGKQVKEYVIRHQYQSNSNSLHRKSTNEQILNSNNNNIMKLDQSSIINDSSITNSSQSNGNSKFLNNNNNSDLNIQSNNGSGLNASSIMMMSPQSAASNQNTSSNFMDLGLIKSNSSNNGKNSPLSSMSSSSMCSIKSLSTPSTKNKSHSTQNQVDEDEIEQTENASSASSTNSFSCFKPNNNIAAIAAAVANMNTNNMSDLTGLMSQSNQNGLNNQMMSLLNNQANTMSKIKSNLLENLLSRKLPNKFISGQQQQQSEMASMAAAVVAASLQNQSPSMSQDDLISQSKSNNLNKLLQNIVDMNQMHNFNSQSTGNNHAASLASSSPSSSSSSSSPLDHINTSFKSELQEQNSDLHRINHDNVDVEQQNEDSCDVQNFHKDADQSDFNTAENQRYDDDSTSNGYQDNENQEINDEKNANYYENENGDLENEENLRVGDHDRCTDEIEENDIRSRSPSNSSKSSGCSSMSSMIQNQFLQQQKVQLQQQFPANANKLLMSHLAGCISGNQTGINQLAIENHLKNFQQQRNLMQQQQQNPHHRSQPHGNCNSYNSNGIKRKKSKEFGLNSFIPQSTPNMMNGMRSGTHSPCNFDHQSNRMTNATPASPDGKQASQDNQIRYSSEIWRCPYCCYETTSASRYNSHLVCHGWKPYLCPHCGSRSNRLPDMRTHISTFHPEFNVNTFVVLSEEEAKATLKDYMKNRALINRKLKEMRPQPKFKCKLCPYASLYQFNLTKHVKSVHLNEIYNQNNNNNNNASNQNNSLSISSNDS